MGTASVPTNKAAAAPSSISLRIPESSGQKSSGFMVLFPGYVKDENKALATFGGEEGLQKQIHEHPKRLHLRLRPSDPYARAIRSNDVRSTTCLVIKLKLVTPSPQSANTKVTAEPIAQVNRVYAFSSPADFQYVGRDQRVQLVGGVHPSAQTGTPAAVEGPEYLDQPPLLCAPPLCAVEDPLEYGFQQYRASDHGIDITGSKGKRGANPMSMVPYTVNEVPQPLELPPQDGADKIGSLGWLQRAFEKRPIFIDSALEEASSQMLKANNDSGSGDVHYPVALSSKAYELRDVLPKICYRFKNGPWKGAWIRRGYDPRNEVEAKRYQVIEFTIPHTWGEIVKSNHEKGGTSRDVPPVLAGTYKDVCSFAGVPVSRSNTLQLCDIEDNQVAEIVDRPENILPQVNEATGWLTSSAWEDILTRLETRYQALYDKIPKAGSVGKVPDQVEPLLSDLMEYFKDGSIDGGVQKQRGEANEGAAMKT